MQRIMSLAFLLAIVLIATPAAAANTADATLEFTITLTAVTITDTASGNSFPAVFETAENAGDLVFEEVEPNGSTFGGGSNNNAPWSVGAGSASETVLLNGLDVSVDPYDQDSFGIGDSLVSRMEVSAAAETPGSAYFGTVSSRNTLYFTPLGSETDQYTFSFDYSASLTGTLDSTPLVGTTQASGGGNTVVGEAEDAASGTPYLFEPYAEYFGFSSIGNPSSVANMSETASGSFVVAFNPGDSNLGIRITSSLSVSARVDPVAEPPEGDFNADGVVDAADYTLFRDGLFVQFDRSDYSTWSQNYGATAPPAAAVPEPGALLLAAMALAASPRRRSFR